MHCRLFHWRGILRRCWMCVFTLALLIGSLWYTASDLLRWWIPRIKAQTLPLPNCRAYVNPWLYLVMCALSWLIPCLSHPFALLCRAFVTPCGRASSRHTMLKACACHVFSDSILLNVLSGMLHAISPPASYILRYAVSCQVRFKNSVVFSFDGLTQWCKYDLPLFWKKCSAEKFGNYNAYNFYHLFYGNVQDFVLCDPRLYSNHLNTHSLTLFALGSKDSHA